MKKRISAVIISLLLFTAMTAGCKSNGSQGPTTSTTASAMTTTRSGTTVSGSTTQETTKKQLTEVSVTVFRPRDIAQNYNDSLYTTYIKDKFNMNIITENTPSSTYQEKLNLLFATGEYPDAMDFVNTTIINRLAKDGFMIALNDYEDRLTNYLNAFTPEEWDAQVKRISNASGKWFAIEIKTAESSSGSNIWMYRMKEFENAGLPLPKTTEDIYNVMKRFKEINPNATIPNRWGVWNALEGFNMAFRVQSDIWFDPDADEIVYGPVTEKYRDLMIFMERLYNEGILSKEFATMTSAQRNAELSKGNVYVNFQFPGAVKVLNGLLESGGKDPDWGWEKDHLLLTAYPDKEPMQQRYKMTLDYGTGLTDKLKGDALDRFLDYLNWCASDEGQIFCEFGVLGVTYEMRDGKPEYIGDAVDKTNPEAYLGNIQSFGPFGYYIIQNEDNVRKHYPEYTETNQYLTGEYYLTFIPLPFRYTIDEESTIADITTIINDVMAEYQLQFIMGVKRAASETDWSEYLGKLRQAGLEDYVRIKKAAYERVYQ